MLSWVRGGLVHICFFFSSRRRHTRFDCDWSSDVCSSDLAAFDGFAVQLHGARAAERSFAAHVRARQARNVAQEMNQQQTRLDLLGITLPVDRKTDVHGVLRRDEFKRCRTYQNSGLSAPIIRLILAAGASGFCRLTFAMLTARETRISD